MRGRLAVFLCAASCSTVGACGAQVYRPLLVDVQGLSARASRLVIKVFTEATVSSCELVSLGNVATLVATVEASWERSQTADQRRFDVGQIDQSSIVIVVYTEDNEGKPLQIACRQVHYSDIETPDLSLSLK